MKYFRMSYEEVVFNRSYLTIMLLNRSIPSFKVDEKEGVNESGKNRDRELGKAQKKYHRVDKAIHANDFFMDMM